MENSFSYLFDIDGTLTEPRQPIDKEFEEFFFNWMQGKKVYLVTGSDFGKIQEQISQRIMDSAAGIFCSMANEFYIAGGLVYANELKLPKDFKEFTNEIFKNSPYSPKRGNNLEFRRGMVNFSIAGRDSSVEERQKYYEYDLKEKEREKIVKLLIDKYGDTLEARIGGQISIDIQNIGNNKSLASKWIRKNIGARMFFFGDKTSPDGNDYDIVKDLLDNKDGIIASVTGPQNTKRVLKDL